MAMTNIEAIKWFEVCRKVILDTLQKFMNKHCPLCKKEKV